MLAFACEEEEALERGDVDAAAALNVAFWAGGAPEPEQALLHEMQALAFRLQAEADPAPVWPEPPVHARLGELDLPVTIVRRARHRRLPRHRPAAGRGAPAGPAGGAARLRALPALERPEEVAGLLLAAAGDG